MRLGRNFTNLLLHERGPERLRKDVAGGRLDAAGVEVQMLVKWKADLKGQIEALKSIGYDHWEIDGEVPNPYLRLRPAQVEEARAAAEAAGVTTSFLLPKCYVASGVCAPQDDDRRAAVRHLKRYLEVAARLGCAWATVGAGWCVRTADRWREIAAEALVRSLVELSEEARAKGLGLLLENNDRRGGGFVACASIATVASRARERGADVGLCVDVASLLTPYNRGDEVPRPFDRLFEGLPEGLVRAAHLSDWSPERRARPPLHREAGVWKEDDWRSVLRRLLAAGCDTLIVESAGTEVDDLVRGRQVIEAETLYIKKVLEAARRAPPSAPIVQSAPAVVLPPLERPSS